MRRGDLRCEGLEVAEAVDQLALRGGAHQRLEFVLAVDLEQQLGGAAQHLQRHRSGR